MRVDLKPVVPRQFTNQPGRWLVVIVHASHNSDYGASARYPINQTLDALLHPARRPLASPINILEILECKRPSYLGLPPQLRTLKESNGAILSQDFYRAHGDLIDSTDTFIFMGGRVNRCLLNAALSVLAYQLFLPEQMLIKGRGSRSPQTWLAKLFSLPRKEETRAINMHFNSEATYASRDNFAPVCRRPEVTDWGPNLPWQFTYAMLMKNNFLLGKVGANVRNYVNGIKLADQAPQAERPGRIINLFYWNRTEDLTNYLNQAA